MNDADLGTSDEWIPPPLREWPLPFPPYSTPDSTRTQAKKSVPTLIPSSAMRPELPHLSTGHVGEGLVPSRDSPVFHAVATGAHEGLPYIAGRDARPTSCGGNIRTIWRYRTSAVFTRYNMG
jgi:hypothetical protein